MQRDAQFYRSMAKRIGQIIREVRPDDIYCDAVEFYNPVHDMTLPLVLGALNGADVPVFEVPLIYQRNDAASSFEIQRVPPSLEGQALLTELTDDEVGRKIRTLSDGRYRALLGQLGGQIQRVLPTHARREQVLKARKGVPATQPGQRLRYDERGRRLKARGVVAEAITYRHHYAPLFLELVDGTRKSPDENG